MCFVFGCSQYTFISNYWHNFYYQQRLGWNSVNLFSISPRLLSSQLFRSSACASSNDHHFQISNKIFIDRFIKYWSPETNGAFFLSLTLESVCNFDSVPQQLIPPRAFCPGTTNHSCVTVPMSLSFTLRFAVWD